MSAPPRRRRTRTRRPGTTGACSRRAPRPRLRPGLRGPPAVAKHRHRSTGRRRRPAAARPDARRGSRAARTPRGACRRGGAGRRRRRRGSARARAGPDGPGLRGREPRDPALGPCRPSAAPPRVHAAGCARRPRRLTPSAAPRTTSCSSTSAWPAPRRGRDRAADLRSGPSRRRTGTRRPRGGVAPSRRGGRRERVLRRLPVRRRGRSAALKTLSAAARGETGGGGGDGGVDGFEAEAEAREARARRRSGGCGETGVTTGASTTLGGGSRGGADARPSFFRGPPLTQNEMGRAGRCTARRGAALRVEDEERPAVAAAREVRPLAHVDKRRQPGRQGRRPPAKSPTAISRDGATLSLSWWRSLVRRSWPPSPLLRRRPSCTARRRRPAAK